MQRRTILTLVKTMRAPIDTSNRENTDKSLNLKTSPYQTPNKQQTSKILRLNSSVVELCVPLSLGGVTFGIRAVNLSEVNLKIIE